MRMELMSVLLSSKINILRQKSDICFTLLLFGGKRKKTSFFSPVFKAKMIHVVL